MSKAKTVEELREEFLIAVRVTAEYWAKETCTSDLDRCEGVAHSILCIIDGISNRFPAAFDLTVKTPPERPQKRHWEDDGDLWTVYRTVINEGVMLNDLFYTDEMKARCEKESEA